MDEISMEIEKLLDAVHRSDEYQEYQKQAAQLEADPELKARVMRFRGDNFRLQNHSDKDELFHIAEQLNQESASLRQNLKVNAYLDAELALCRLMQRICRTLVDGSTYRFLTYRRKDYGRHKRQGWQGRRFSGWRGI